MDKNQDQFEAYNRTGEGEPGTYRPEGWRVVDEMLLRRFQGYAPREGVKSSELYAPEKIVPVAA